MFQTSTNQNESILLRLWYFTCFHDDEFPLNDDAEKLVTQIEFSLFKTYWVGKGNNFKKKQIKQSTDEDTPGSVWHIFTNAMCREKKRTF